LNVLVLGIGNVLLMDEGAGVRAVEEMDRRFQLPESVETLDGGTSGIDLLPYIRNRDYLIIIDAVKSGHPPGAVVRVEGEDVPATFRTRISPHQLGLSDLLAAARLTGEFPARMVLFGVEPKRIEVGLGLSDEVKEGLEQLIDMVAGELRSLGCEVELKAGATPAAKSFWEE